VRSMAGMDEQVAVVKYKDMGLFSRFAKGLLRVQLKKVEKFESQFIFNFKFILFYKLKCVLFAR